MKKLLLLDEHKRHKLALGYDKENSWIMTVPENVKLDVTLCDRGMELFEDSLSVANFDSTT